MRNYLTLKFVGLIFLVFVSIPSVAFAGGYCPTWVQISHNTSAENVFSAGSKFLASVFEITAGADADVTVTKVSLKAKGNLNFKDVAHVILTDVKGVRYGYTKRISSKGDMIMRLSKSLVIKKGETVNLYLHVKIKSTAKFATVTLGIADLVGTIKSTYIGDGFDDIRKNKSVYCSTYSEFTDPVFGKMHYVTGAGKGVHALEFRYKNAKATTEVDEWTPTDLNESYVVSVDVKSDSYNHPYIFLKFNNSGAKIFEKVTEQNVGNVLGIFIKGELISAPIVRERISGGDAQIAGSFTAEEATKLAKQIKSGIVQPKIF